jgi:hypothetical protein
MVDVVTEVFRQNPIDGLKCSAPVVILKILDVLQYEGAGSVIIEDISNLEKEITLLFIVKSVFTAQAILLGDAREAEGLTRKAPAKNIVIGNGADPYAVNVAVGFLMKISLVSTSRIFIPIARKDALTARSVEG